MEREERRGERGERREKREERREKREERREKREEGRGKQILPQHDLRNMSSLANGDLPVDGNQENSEKPSERWKIER